jgi:hypothetical protein
MFENKRNRDSTNTWWRDQRINRLLLSLKKPSIQFLLKLLLALSSQLSSSTTTIHTGGFQDDKHGYNLKQKRHRGHSGFHVVKVRMSVEIASVHTWIKIGIHRIAHFFRWREFAMQIIHISRFQCWRNERRFRDVCMLISSSE